MEISIKIVTEFGEYEVRNFNSPDEARDYIRLIEADYWSEKLNKLNEPIYV